MLIALTLLALVLLVAGLCSRAEFRQFLADGLRELAGMLAEPVVHVEVATPLLRRARELTAHHETQWTDGEQRRHQVYAQLIKEFPGESKRALSRAIEAGLPDV